MVDTSLIYPYEFQGGKKAVASEVNANFEAVKSFANGINVSLNDIRNALTDLKNKPTREILDIYYSFSGVTPSGAYPLWTGETITHCKSLYPQFWNKVKSLSTLGNLVAVSAEDYEKRIEDYGQCAAFYIDDLNGHLRLPKITKFISSIEQLSELAKEEKAGLPNITGTTKAQDGYARNPDPTGAFESWEMVGGSSRTGDGGKTAMVQKFDASKSNEIYGTSETVQPPAVKLCLYIQVANNLGEISELDTQAIAKELEQALVSLEASFKSYNADLKATYDQIKGSIIQNSPIIKESEVEVLLEMFCADETYPAYPYCANIPMSESTNLMVPTVVFSLDDASSGNYAPIAEAIDGIVKIYAKEVPAAKLSIPSIVLQ